MWVQIIEKEDYHEVMFKNNTPYTMCGISLTNVQINKAVVKKPLFNVCKNCCPPKKKSKTAHLRNYSITVERRK